MATLNQLAAKIANTLNQPYNHELKERIKDSYRFMYAERVRQSIEKNGIDDELKVKYVAEVQKVDKADNCFINVGCDILRTVNKIPKLVRYKSDVPFTFVGTVDGITFVYTSFASARFIKHLPLIGNTIFYSYENDYIYLYGNIKLKQIAIQSVFSDINKVITLCDNENNCVTDDMEFPLPEDMISNITATLLKQEFGIVQTQSNEVTINGK